MAHPFTCSDCGMGHSKSDSMYCSVCRPYRLHPFKAADKYLREINPAACNLCGLESDATIHPKGAN